MNAARLLAHYEQIADAPDAIARLRRFILDLAVRGKLVPQEANEETDPELLKRVAKETLDQSALPKGWLRAKVGSVLDFQYGKGLKASERLDEGPVPVFGSNGIVGFTDEPLTLRPAIIVGRKGSAGALNLCDGPSWTTDVAYFVEAPLFLDVRFLLSALAALDLDKLGKGVKPGLSRSEAYDLVIAIPPLAEQHRIVAKVDELMGLCDRLEAARAGREATRDRLAAASLARLNTPDPETFQADARFALDALPALTVRPDQIKRLRQTILNLAVRGKLVPQDPNDEAAKGFRKPNDPAAPFKLPNNWKWIEIGDQLDLLNGMAFKPTDWAKEGLRIVRIQNLNNQDAQFNFCDPEMARERSLIDNGSFLISWSGTPGTSFGAFIWDRGPAVLNQHIFRCDFKTKAFVAAFLRLAINGRLDEMIAKAHGGVGLQHITKGKLEALLIPLPPLAEQHRIVAKVDALMALCDRLEASLAATAATRRRLLDALLAESLVGPESLAA